MSQPTETERANAIANLVRGLGILCFVAMAFRILPMILALPAGIALILFSFYVRSKLLSQISS